ncbi:hypothetical protein [Mycobacterium lacus]|uniref:Uncharacterized protein n=1 Tax=Mycobacterium lacus TaxID=169765 RepID=A0A1X1Y5M5_9MYCO|nr:hypothetical protein [Mycobacterium lacus]MCV7121961.1 hypothetical protein [Mycobacterium lacus]ORW06369.1 hypothetical protein AWC15_21825 [Mycobacterium lacus]BBX98541.1 hypothetical protein MLAC_38350 [Mycobacterium lacus]
MRLSQKAWWGLAGVLAGGALVAGCSTTIDGRPVASPGSGPTEPSFPTSSAAPPTAAPTTPASPTAPAGAIPLPPDQSGYVFIETKSGQTRCQINTESVGCEAPFKNSPIQDGEHANGVRVTANGSVQWVLGNLGAIPTVTIDYKTYDAVGWTIVATTEGTRFTNSRTGHGMFVSIEKVSTF